MKLLTEKNHKLCKAEEYGWLNVAVQLQPCYSDKICPWVGRCKHTCLANTGRNATDMAEQARIARTVLFLNEPKIFKAMLIAEIAKAYAKATKKGLGLCVRPDGTSDCVLRKFWDLPELFPDVMFVNYTKNPGGFESSRVPTGMPWRTNVFITYSINEKTEPWVPDSFFEKGYNCSMVFYPTVPDKVILFDKEYPVCNGEKNDLRFLDPPGHVVGLRYKQARPKLDGRRFAIKPTETNDFIFMTEDA